MGTSSKLPQSVGKLAKALKVPVVVINMKGYYLQSPIWNLSIRKEVRLEATITQLYTAAELTKATTEQVNETLQQYLTYDEYAYQYETGQKIPDRKRAEGLELVLYQCPGCNREFTITSRDADLHCNHCGEQWHMTELGRLANVRSTKELEIPKWYELVDQGCG